MTNAASVEESLELAKRAFALKKYEQAVDHYATALELMYVSRRGHNKCSLLFPAELILTSRCRTAKHGEDAPEAADLYFAYGKALLENAIVQTSVLGKEQAEDALKGEEGRRAILVLRICSSTHVGPFVNQSQTRVAAGRSCRSLATRKTSR